MTTETTGQHTPTPWDLQTLRVSLVPVMIRVNGYTKETAAANAAFIVRACNNHDALVGALQGYKDMTDNILARKEFSNNDFETMKTALTFILPQTVKTLTAATKET